jgi:hypothetical protein
MLRARGEYVFLDIAAEDRVFGLKGRNGMNGLRPLDDLGGSL